MTTRHFRAAAVACAAACAFACGGCAGPRWSGSVSEGLQHEDPSVRIAACVKAADENDGRALPLLVERLEDSCSDVRMFAAGALRRITKKGLRYRYYAGEQERAQAVRRWREWLKLNRLARAGD